MDKHFLKTIKLVAEFLVCDDYEFIQNKQSDCDGLCINEKNVTFKYDNEYIIFKNCNNLQNRKSIQYLYNILKLYIKTFKKHSQEPINPITSHELKGMLSTAMLSLEMLEKYDFGIEDRNKLTKQAFESVSKSVKVFEEMLHIEKLNYQNETNSMKIENIDILKLINKNINSLATSMQIKKITLNIEDKTNNQAMVFGDYFWLDRAIFNLIANAIEHNIINGFININLAWEKNILKISITNSCLDVKESDREKLFDKFQTSDDAQNTGTGIGLSLVKAVANTHGALIDFGSKTSGQMTFNLELPYKVKSKMRTNSLAVIAATFIAFMIGASYFFPIIPIFDKISKKGEFDIIEIEDGKTIKIKNSSNYNFWHFRNLNNSKSYKRLHISGGYVETEINGDTIHIATSNSESSKIATLLSSPSGIKLDNLNNGKIKITAKTVKNAKQYRFIVAKDEKFKNIIGFYHSDKPTIVASMSKGGCCYTKVMAVDENGVAGKANVIKIKNLQATNQTETIIKK